LLLAARSHTVVGGLPFTESTLERGVLTLLRIATFNVENLFRRPRALNADDPEMQKAVLRDIERLKELIAKKNYTATNKDEMTDILKRNQVKAPTKRPFFVNVVRGRLFNSNTLKIVANGRDDFVGWVETDHDTIDEEAIRNTARVIDAVNPDVLCLVEVENRLALDQFNREIIRPIAGSAYSHNMLIDGNDPRGIDVAILSRHPIRNMRCHIQDRTNGNRIFSRDCPEYEVLLPSGASLWLLCNHFKSKIGGGGPKRRQQAERVKQILTANHNLQTDLVVVAGDLNDTPDSQPLSPLLQVNRLHDVVNHLPSTEPRFTYKDGPDQIDYLLVSEPLEQGINNVRIERRGIFSAQFPHFPEVSSATTSASDHAAVVAEFNIG
jgi:endonuclease/exonuclease/phosphatase family metal-dependent hydrolase